MHRSTGSSLVERWLSGSVISMAAESTTGIGESLDTAGDEQPTKEELMQIVLDQQDQIDALNERVKSLEKRVQDVEYEADTVEEVAEKLQEGKIGGEAGAEFIFEYVDLPESSTKLDARSKQLFGEVIRQRKVDSPVTSTMVAKWLGLQDSANPSVQAKRVMERLVQHREDGYFLGQIELAKHRGKNAIFLNGRE